jgi:hypothetical protein
MTASVHVIELGFSDGVVDVDGREEKSTGSSHFVKTLDTGGGFLGHSDKFLRHTGPASGVLGEVVTDKTENDLEFEVICGGGVREGSILGIELFSLDTFVDEESGITTIINKEIRAITSRPDKGLFSAPPVLFEGLTLPGKDSGRVTGDSRGSVILGGENVARAPTDLSAESSEGLNESSGLDGHVEGSSDLGTLERLLGTEFRTARHETRHLSLSKFNLQATEIGLGHVLDLELQLGKGRIGDCKHLLTLTTMFYTKQPQILG